MSISATPRFGRITYQVERIKPSLYSALSPQEFQGLLKSSGLDKELQGAADSPKRFADIYQPKSWVVVARDIPEADTRTLQKTGFEPLNTSKTPGKPVGVASIVTLGEYNFLSTLAVDPQYQHKGIGKKLIDTGILASRAQYKTETDSGHASLATLTSADNFRDKTEKRNQFYLKAGFIPLNNAAVFSRSQQKLSYLG
jgi:GNAT superfamily N-acetyltransferase